MRACLWAGSRASGSFGCALRAPLRMTLFLVVWLENCGSGGLAGGYCGGPGPLEVVAAEPAGDVDDFADEVEARGDAALHGTGVERVGRDAAGGDLGFVVAFGAGGSRR